MPPESVVRKRGPWVCRAQTGLRIIQPRSFFAVTAQCSEIPFCEKNRPTTAVKLAFNQYTIETTIVTTAAAAAAAAAAGNYNMPSNYLPMIQSYKAPESDREVQLRLYNHIYLFTTHVGTQTDPEVFFMNGKPARAVQPFRVVQPKPKEIVSQMAQLEQALVGQAVQVPVYNAQDLAGMHYMAAWPSAPMEEHQYQEVAAPLPEQEQAEVEEMPEASALPAVQERVSQETQTDIEYVEDEGTDTGSASEESTAE